MTAKEFIKSKQNGVLLNDYTLQEMEWFMTEFVKQEVSEQLCIGSVRLSLFNEVYDKFVESYDDDEFDKSFRETLEDNEDKQEIEKL